jgi:hypothetical protein
MGHRKEVMLFYVDTKGKHKIRFIINKKDSEYIITFGVSSMLSQLLVYS